MLICNIDLIQSQTYFNKRYPVTDGWGSVGFNAVENDSGYFSASVYISLTTGKQNLRMLQTDFEGNILFEKIYGDTTYSYFVGFQGSLQKVNSGGYIMFGGKQNINKNYDLLYRFNDVGDTLWTKTLGDTTVAYGHVGDNMKVTPDGGFICIGDRGSPSAPISIIKTDSLGNQQWGKFYGGTTYDKPTSIALCSDGGYIYCTTTKSGGVGLPTYYNIRVMKVDSLGNMVFNKFYGDVKDDEALGIIQTQDGGYVVATSYSTASGLYFPSLLKLNNLGDSLWLRKVVPFTGNGFNNFSTVLELSDGSLVAAGKNWFTDSVTFGRDKGLVAKITASGDLVWQREHDLTTCATCTNYNSYLYDMRTTSDGGFICSGVTTPPQDMWLLKLDSLGCADTACALATALEETKEISFWDFKVYPNPAHSFITVELQHPISSVNFKLIDLTGKQVLTQQLNTSYTQINVQELPKGIYFYELISEKERYSGKLVVQ